MATLSMEGQEDYTVNESDRDSEDLFLLLTVTMRQRSCVVLLVLHSKIFDLLPSKGKNYSSDYVCSSYS